MSDILTNIHYGFILERVCHLVGLRQSLRSVSLETTDKLNLPLV